METDYGIKISASSYIEVPTNTAYNFGKGDFTVTVLFQTKQSGALLSNIAPQGATEGAGWLIYIEDNGAIRFTTSNGQGYFQVTSSPTVVLDNTWHSIAAMRLNGGLFIFLDGENLHTTIQSSLPTPLDVSNTRRLLFGNSDDQQVPNPQFVGVLEDITIWNKALNADQIRDTMFNNVDPSSNGLVGFWEMNKDFTDTSPIKNEADPIGNVHFIPIYHCVWVEGNNHYSYCSIDMHEDIEEDYGANISGTGQITIPSNQVYNFGTGDFSLTALFRTTQPGTIMSRKSSEEGAATDAGWLLVVNPNGVFQMKTDNGLGYYEVNSGATDALNGHWHSVAVTRTSGQIAIYYNGIKIPVTPKSTLNTPLNVSNSENLIIGNSIQPQNPYKQFEGTLEDITIWNKAINESEIQDTRFNGLSGNEAGLVGFWKMDNNFNDASPTGNNGASSGNVTFIPIAHPAIRRQSLNIPTGTPYLYGAVFDKELNNNTFPEDTILKVYRPDGTQLTAATAENNEYVLMSFDSVHAFNIENPQAGDWIFSLESPSDVPILFNAQTVPSTAIPQTITTNLQEVYDSPPASHVRFLAKRDPVRLAEFTWSWSSVAKWAGIGIAAVATVVTIAAVAAGATIMSPVVLGAAVAVGVGSAITNMGLMGEVSNAAYEASYKIGVGSASGGGSSNGSYAIVMDGQSYFPLLRNLLMAVQTGSYSATGKVVPDQPTFENLFKAISDAGKKAYVMMFNTAAIYHMIENADIVKFFPRKVIKGVDARDNYKSKAALTQYENIRVAMESYNSSSSYTPLYSQHQKLAIFSVNGVKVGLVGGFNITPSYWDDETHPMSDHNNFHTWHDTAVLLQGPIVEQVENEFNRRWVKSEMHYGLPQDGTYVKFSCYHVKHDTCLDGTNNCTPGTPSKFPYTNPITSDPQYPIDVLITSSEYEEKFTQIKDKIIEQINASSVYSYFENFTFHDLDVVNAIANKLSSNPNYSCIINVPYPTKGNDTEDQRGQFYMIRVAYAVIVLKTGKWSSIAFDGGTIITKDQCSSASVSVPDGKGIEYAVFNYTLKSNGQSYSVAIGSNLINLEETTDSNLIFTSAVRYFDTLSPNEEKFQLPGLSVNFRSIYIHSKLALFDDKYAIIGSANYNSRSLTYDGECSIGVNSAAKAIEIRQEIFAHWGMDTVANWKTKMQSNAQNPQQGVCAVPLPIRVLSSSPIPWYWKYASYIYEFSDIN
ncbi:LamG-like jellyroll fold domain-containing protein [Leptobacterium sp. I13]|uniref:LamG-like jellyroll fold domain-containing protein n=1 Tax=Leptobacterium meishanense TaxID=3128904 RepID=UPI0030EF8050